MRAFSRRDFRLAYNIPFKPSSLAVCSAIFLTGKAWRSPSWRIERRAPGWRGGGRGGDCGNAHLGMAASSRDGSLVRLLVLASIALGGRSWPSPWPVGLRVYAVKWKLLSRAALLFDRRDLHHHSFKPRGAPRPSSPIQRSRVFLPPPVGSAVGGFSALPGAC